MKANDGKIDWNSNKKILCFSVFKITEKASEASYVYILSEQKFIKNAKNGHFGDLLKPQACGQTV